jgi:hypothetical protein
VPIARPEYGPSLKDLVGPRVAALSRRARWALYAAPIVLAILIVAVLILRADRVTQAVVRGPLTFNTRFDDRIARVAAGPGELLHLRTKPGPGRGDEDLVFRDAGPAPPRDEPAGGPIAQLALRMEAVMRPVRAELSGFQLRSQGRIRIGSDYGGWIVRYQFRKPAAARDPDRSSTFYGARILLLPDARGTRERVLDISLQSQQSNVVSNISEAGGNGPMRTPFYGVGFGTEKP